MKWTPLSLSIHGSRIRIGVKAGRRSKSQDGDDNHATEAIFFICTVMHKDKGRALIAWFGNRLDIFNFLPTLTPAILILLPWMDEVVTFMSLIFLMQSSSLIVQFQRLSILSLRKGETKKQQTPTNHLFPSFSCKYSFHQRICRQ